jgi:putative two-component system response regulator
MIVDDDPIQLLYLSKTLATVKQSDIVTQTSAQAALSLCTENVWDLVIVDYQMPDIDGVNFVEKLRLLSNHVATPVLMVTASSDPVIKHKVLRHGTIDFLQKPVDAIELQARARNLINLNQATKKLENENITLEKNVSSLIEELKLREYETLSVLAKTAEYRDSDTGSHLIRMAEYSRLIGINLKLDPELTERIFLAAPMHDVGKIGIPDGILLKPGKLSPEEWSEMQRHTEYGHEIFRHSRTPVLQLSGEIAWAHHESWDGSGYPRGLKGEQIPLSARIVAVADVFDALTTQRPYKSAWSVEDAIAELHKLSGQKLEPACVDALLMDPSAIQKIMQKAPDE